MPTPTQLQTIRTSPGASNTGVLENVTAGALLICEVSYYSTNSNGAITVSDDVNGAWTVNESQNNGTNRIAMAYFENAGSGNTTVTVASSGTGDQYISAVAAEVNGMETSGALDVDTGNTGDGDPISTGTTATTAQNDEMVVCVFGDAADACMNTPAGFTSLDLITSNATFQPLSAAWKDVAATGTQEAGFSDAQLSNWSAGIACFKVAGGGGGDPIRVRFPPELSGMGAGGMTGGNRVS